MEHLVTQMKWRLQEGQGEAIYEIGVEDNGVLAGLTDHEMKASMDTLHTMATRSRSYIYIFLQGSHRIQVCTGNVPEFHKCTEKILEIWFDKFYEEYANQKSSKNKIWWIINMVGV